MQLTNTATSIHFSNAFVNTNIKKTNSSEGSIVTSDYSNIDNIASIQRNVFSNNNINNNQDAELKNSIDIAYVNNNAKDTNNNNIKDTNNNIDSMADDKNINIFISSNSFNNTSSMAKDFKLVNSGVSFDKESKFTSIADSDKADIVPPSMKNFVFEAFATDNEAKKTWYSFRCFQRFNKNTNAF